MVPIPIIELYRMANAHGIELIAWYPDLRCPPGRYVCDEWGQRMIYLNPIYQRDGVGLRCNLAHGIGYAATDATGKEQAKRWARNILLPDEWIMNRLEEPMYKIAAAAGVYADWVFDRLCDLSSVANL